MFLRIHVLLSKDSASCKKGVRCYEDIIIEKQRQLD